MEVAPPVKLAFAPLVGAFGTLPVALPLQAIYDTGVRAAIRSSGTMKFGKRIRELRQSKGWTLRDLAPKVGVGFTYICKVENEKLDFGDYPSDALIHRLADALEADEEELLILAERIPEPIQKRVLQRPDAFRAFANCDDKTLDRLMGQIGWERGTKKVGKSKEQ